jgi:hypothetical protein
MCHTWNELVMYISNHPMNSVVRFSVLCVLWLASVCFTSNPQPGGIQPLFLHSFTLLYVTLIASMHTSFLPAIFTLLNVMLIVSWMIKQSKEIVLVTNRFIYKVPLVPQWQDGSRENDLADANGQAAE